MMPLRSAARIVALPLAHCHFAPSRAISTQTTQAMAKLQVFLEGYRQVNYAQEIPTRFKKDIARAAGPNSIVVASGLERVLQNIGASNLLSSSEMQSIFIEMGNEKGEISAQQLVRLL